MLLWRRRTWCQGSCLFWFCTRLILSQCNFSRVRSILRHLRIQGRRCLGSSLSFLLRCCALKEGVYSVDRFYSGTLGERATLVLANPFHCPDDVLVTLNMLVILDSILQWDLLTLTLIDVCCSPSLCSYLWVLVLLLHLQLQAGNPSFGSGHALTER